MPDASHVPSRVRRSTTTFPSNVRAYPCTVNILPTLAPSIGSSSTMSSLGDAGAEALAERSKASHIARTDIAPINASKTLDQRQAKKSPKRPKLSLSQSNANSDANSLATKRVIAIAAAAIRRGRGVLIVRPKRVAVRVVGLLLIRHRYLATLSSSAPSGPAWLTDPIRVCAEPSTQVPPL